MKNEFMLAFNEICEERGLSKETVIDALKTALVSAYRRNVNVSNTQQVSVEIDPRTGEPTIYAEKEAVDSIIDNRTEVLVDDARRAGYADVQEGDMVMIDSTPRDFGRIAAQTAKQVILQRVREAEREQLFDEFKEREGEIVNGTVQSVSGGNITIGLGRTEAMLPRSQQVHGERYRPHDKIRVYVLEVRRTNRGPQIIVSRNHRNLLRRLLELEVPEIYNGQVDIKSIAREAGARSKVAVMALQPGVDPVGACVGMRGVRIQSIVRELNDEKIDVIEWDPDQRNFIAKALSPARVSQVFLEDHPETGKTASVIVPDDQLSLAIGREGQNARLAAKLTGWRIDIKSLTESATEALDHLDHPSVPQAVQDDTNLLEQARIILEKKAANRPITAEDYSFLGRLVSDVEGRLVAERNQLYEEQRRLKTEVRQNVTKETWEANLGELDISEEAYHALVDAGYRTVGNVLFKMALNDDVLLEIEDFSREMQREVENAIDALDAEYAAALAEVEAEAEEEPEVEADVEEEADVVAEAEPVVEAEAEEEVTEVAPEPEEEEAPAPVAEEEEMPEPVAAADVESATDEEPESEEEPLEEEEAEVIGGIEPLESILDESELEDEEEEEDKGKVVIVGRTGGWSDDDGDDDDDDRRGSRKGKRLVYDEKAGRVVVKRKRKRRRQTQSWEDLDELDDF